MKSPLDSYNDSLESVRSLHALHNHLCNLLPAMDLSEILRAEVVLIVSAFDCYIHEIVRCGFLRLFKGVDDCKNTKFNEFSIPITTVKQMLEVTTDEEKMQILDISIKKILSKDSYQSPTSIENALQLISIKKIWSSIKEDMGMSSMDIKRKLGLIINRRNKIVHEADKNNSIDTSKNVIERDDVDDIMQFISNLVKSIDKQITMMASS